MLIAICDDERLELEGMSRTLKAMEEELPAGVAVAAYPSGQALLDAVRDGVRPDLVILDIYMEGWDGIETARRLRAVFPALPVAFLTASREHAVDAFDLDALHYLIKPVTQEKLRSLLNRFLAREHQPPPALTLVCGREKHQFPVSKIQYLVSLDRGTKLYLDDRGRGQWLGCPFRQAAEQLAENPDFLQISRSCIVNLNAVQYIGREDCHMKNGAVLSISRRERQAVQNRYSDFLFRKMNQIKENIL